MANSRPQLNLDEMRRFKWLLGGLVALVSLWTVFFLEVEALSLVVLASALIVATLVRPDLPAKIPLLVWRLSVPAIIVVVVADLSFSPETLPALIRLAVLLVLYRAVSYRRKREDLQLLVLSLFLIVVAGVLTVSLGFAFLLLLFTAGALGFLFCVTLIDLVDTGPKVMRPEEMREVPAWAQLPWSRFFRRLRQVADWRLVGFSAGLFVLVVGFSAVLFLLIPRFDVGSGFFLDKYITRKTRTGFSEDVKFGNVGELIKDDSIAMRVDLTDATSLRELPYLRLMVLDEYTPDGFRLSLDLRKKLAGSQRERQNLEGRRRLASVGRGVGGSWTFYVEPDVSRFLPLPGNYAGLRFRERMRVQTSLDQHLVALATESVAMIAFQLDDVALDGEFIDPDFARSQRSGVAVGYDQRITLKTPTGPDNEMGLRRALSEINAGRPAGEAREFVRRATEWLRGRHRYALSVRIPTGKGDSIVRWLDSSEPGFCEYFAAALAVLCRAEGHPARVVTGFHGGTLNAYENYYMVKNSDAHAWVEVYDGQRVWFRADPTPGANAVSMESAAGSNGGSMPVSERTWSARFDSLRVLWYRRIVNFDSRQQVQLLSEMKSMTSETGVKLRDRLERAWRGIRAWVSGPWDHGRMFNVLKLAGALIVMLWAGLRAWHWTRHGWRAWREPGRFDPVRHEAGEWLRRLEARRADSGQNLTVSDEEVPVREELLRLRYGRRETWPEPQAVFRRARQVRRARRT